jgi:hypothetical protein
VPLTPHGEAKVGIEDYAWITQWKWKLKVHPRTGKQYAARNVTVDHKSKFMLMHRQIMGLPFGDKREVDHRDGDGLNNQRGNLRIAISRSHNNHSRAKTDKKVSSSYRGVSRRKDSGRWVASIGFKGKKKHIGCFLSEKDAALAYDQAAKSLYGEFVRPNFRGKAAGA